MTRLSDFAPTTYGSQRSTALALLGLLAFALPAFMSAGTVPLSRGGVSTSAPAANAVSAAADKAAEIEALVRAYEDAERFSGSILVAEKGAAIFRKGYGPANREWNIPNAPDTKFRIGSMTKQFTAMLVMQLVAEKKVDLQAKLSAYLPFYRKDVGEKVTIHHLLTHTSGIPSYTDDMAAMEQVVRDPYPPAEFVAKSCSGDLQFEPGSRFRYSNSGFFILGAVVEAVTGKPYEQLLQERIFGPLGMKNTGYDRPGPVLANRAAGYVSTFDGCDNARYMNMSLPYAAGALYSTVDDLFLWDRALSTDKLLGADLRAVMFKPQVTIGGGVSYAYGWMVRERAVPGGGGAAGKEEAKAISVFHGGAIFGFSSYFERLVDEGRFIVLLDNAPEADLGTMADGIVEILHGRPWKRPAKSVTRAIYGTLLEKGTTEAIRRYHEIKQTRAAEYDFNPAELNALGYYLLNAKKMTAAALEIFKLNIAEYPKYANGYDSLAEALLVSGDKAQAVVNYAKSLELNPGNVNAIRKLAELIK